MKPARAFAFAVILSAAAVPAAGGDCRLALALALDVSGSVDGREYRLQVDGLAAALADADVQSALFAMPGAPVALAIYEWSSSSYQRVIVDWTELGSPADVEAVRAILTGWRRVRAPEATGLGAALEFGANLMRSAPACWEQTLDVSADGQNNDWPIPQRLRDMGRLGTMTVNGLVIGAGMTKDIQLASGAELANYFRNSIIHGPAAFVEVARGYDDYADAMTRKLLRELSTLPLGGLPDPDPGDPAAGADRRLAGAGRP